MGAHEHEHRHLGRTLVVEFAADPQAQAHVTIEPRYSGSSRVCWTDLDAQIAPRRFVHPAQSSGGRRRGAALSALQLYRDAAVATAGWPDARRAEASRRQRPSATLAHRRHITAAKIAFAGCCASSW